MYAVRLFAAAIATRHSEACPYAMYTLHFDRRTSVSVNQPLTYISLDRRSSGFSISYRSHQGLVISQKVMSRRVVRLNSGQVLTHTHTHTRLRLRLRAHARTRLDDCAIIGIMHNYLL
jgi:hypothetical protein